MGSVNLSWMELLKQLQISSNILFTSCRGLEVVDRNSNSWKEVQPLPHALHVHVGDHMEVLSNGKIKTVVHRAVLNPEEARISMASINGFPMHEKVSSARELVDEQNPWQRQVGVQAGRHQVRRQASSSAFHWTRRGTTTSSSSPPFARRKKHPSTRNSAAAAPALVGRSKRTAAAGGDGRVSPVTD